MTESHVNERRLSRPTSHPNRTSIAPSCLRRRFGGRCRQRSTGDGLKGGRCRQRSTGDGLKGGRCERWPTAATLRIRTMIDTDRTRHHKRTESPASVSPQTRGLNPDKEKARSGIPMRACCYLVKGKSRNSARPIRKRTLESDATVDVDPGSWPGVRDCAWHPDPSIAP